jgi:hypothetical protein
VQSLQQRLLLLLLSVFAATQCAALSAHLLQPATAQNGRMMQPASIYSTVQLVTCIQLLASALVYAVQIGGIDCRCAVKSYMRCAGMKSTKHACAVSCSIADVTVSKYVMYAIGNGTKQLSS